MELVAGDFWLDGRREVVEEISSIAKGSWSSDGIRLLLLVVTGVMDGVEPANAPALVVGNDGIGEGDFEENGE